MEQRDALEASANELFEVVTLGKVRIDINQCFALKDAASRPRGIVSARNFGLHHPDH
jgi:hypothetical protein